MDLYNIELERSALSSLMSIEGLLEQSGLEILDGYFYAGKHKEIFNAIKSLHDSKQSYDVVMVHEYLESRQGLEAIGGEEYLADLLNNAPATKFNFESYVTRLKDLAKRREVKQIFQDNLAVIDDFDIPNQDLISNTIASLNASNVATGTQVTTRELCIDFFNLLNDKKNGKIEPYINTGFAELDNKLCLNRGDLCVIAGRPSMGKSTLAQNMLTFITQTTGKTGVFFSLEMPSMLVIERLTSAIGSVNLSHIKTGHLTGEEWDGATKAADFLGDVPLVIDDASNATVGEMRAKLNQIKHKQGKIGVVVVDYLGLMGGISKDPVNEIGEITKQMKAIAKDFDCPVLLLSQLNRSVEKNPDKRPRLSDLRDSGKIEQDADQVIALYRDEYYNKDSQQQGVAEAIILKNRNGVTGTVRLGFEGQYSRFTNLVPNFDLEVSHA